MPTRVILVLIVLGLVGISDASAQLVAQATDQPLHWRSSGQPSTPWLNSAVRNASAGRLRRGQQRATTAGPAGEHAREHPESEGGHFGGIFSVFSPLSGTESRLRELQSPLRELREPLQDLATQVGEMRHPMEGLKGPIGALPAEIQNLRGQIGDLRQPMTDLRQPISDLKHPLQGLSTPITDLKGSIGGLQAPLVGIETPLARLPKPLTDLVPPMTNLNERLDRVAAVAPAVSELSTSLREVKGEVQELHSQIGILERSIHEIARNISLAVILGAVLIGASIIVSRKVPSIAQPTRTFVESVEDESMVAPTTSQERVPAGRKTIKTVMMTQSISATEVKDRTARG